MAGSKEAEREPGSSGGGGFLASFRGWFDTSSEGREVEGPDRIDWLRCTPFIIMHIACLLVLVVGWSWTAVGLAVFFYYARMFALTSFYHRYFSHRSFKTSRPMQFLLAVAGNSCVQRGPLWWAAHHRNHHRVSDTPEDPHSPTQHGFLWSHIGWFMSRRNFRTRTEWIRDFARYPELRFLDRFDVLVPLAGAVTAFLLGEALARVAPGLGTSGFQFVVWAIVSTTFLVHGTSTINSLAHLFGRKRYATSDTSRNSFLLTLITLGEGWHNNHHYHMSSTRLGHRWWEIDPAWYLLVALSWTGLIWDLKPVPDRLLVSRRVREQAA